MTRYWVLSRLLFLLAILWVLSSTAHGQSTRVRWSQLADPPPPPQSLEGDWCPVPVFVLSSPLVLQFTPGASTSHSCFLRTTVTQVSTWTSSATVTILLDSSQDDVAYFFWDTASTTPTLRVSARHPEQLLCVGCVLDTARTVDQFPPNTLVAGFYPIVAGIWTGAGHPVINQHQILIGSVPTTVTYLPNLGYSFSMDPSTPALQSATQALASQVQTAQGLTTQIRTQIRAAQAATPASISTLTARVDNTDKSLMMVAETIPAKLPTDAQVASVARQLATLQGQLTRLQSMASGPGPGPGPNYYGQFQDLQSQLYRMKQDLAPQLVPPPTDSSAPCSPSMWSADPITHYLYRCIAGHWGRSPLEVGWK